MSDLAFLIIVAVCVGVTLAGMFVYTSPVTVICFLAESFIFSVLLGRYLRD